MRAFSQVDVFSTSLHRGNPVAVVHDADGLTSEEMARFARWTNLRRRRSCWRRRDASADYRLRIFTPAEELPFAGHPTIGSAHAWLERGGRPRWRTTRWCRSAAPGWCGSDGRRGWPSPPRRCCGPDRPPRPSGRR